MLVAFNNIYIILEHIVIHDRMGAGEEGDELIDGVVCSFKINNINAR